MLQYAANTMSTYTPLYTHETPGKSIMSTVRTAKISSVCSVFFRTGKSAAAYDTKFSVKELYISPNKPLLAVPLEKLVANEVMRSRNANQMSAGIKKRQAPSVPLANQNALLSRNIKYGTSTIGVNLSNDATPINTPATFDFLCCSARYPNITREAINMSVCPR